MDVLLEKNKNKQTIDQALQGIKEQIENLYTLLSEFSLKKKKKGF